MNPSVQKVLVRLHELGVHIKFVNTGDIDDAIGPLSPELGVDYATKTLYFTGFCDENTVGYLIHEGAHILASRRPPNTSREYEFLGWEMALAMELDLLGDWLRGSGNYKIMSSEGLSYMLKEIDEDELSELIENNVTYACSTGLVVNDRAVAIR